MSYLLEFLLLGFSHPQPEVHPSTTDQGPDLSAYKQMLLVGKDSKGVKH